MQQLKTILTAILMLCCATLSAHDFEVDGIYYNITGAKTVEVTYGGTSYSSAKSYSGSVTIPSSVTYNGTTYSVTTIGFGAFDGCSSLTNIEIPNSVTTIKVAAFRDCSSLKSIEIPNNTTTIGDHAFSGCSSLTNIEIPNNVTTIEINAFRDCSSLTSIVIPNNVTAIGRGAFSGCRRLTSIEFPNSVTTIGDDAFYATPWYNNQPDGVVYAGKVLYTYKGTMPANTSISIKEGTAGIAGDAFENCNNLTSIRIPNSVKTIGDNAFKGCSSLESIEIPNSVTNIGSSAFEGCSNLESIEISNSVTIIKDNAFNNTSWYNNQPDGVVYAGKVLYKYKGTMPANTSISIKEGTLSITNFAFSGSRNLVSITIPNSVTTIGDYAFSFCTGLTSIEIPNSVTTIGMGAFSDCGNLTGIDIPKSATSIGDSAFRNCNSITRVIIPNGVTTIEGFVFDCCESITHVTLPSSITSIGYDAFNLCSNLTSFISLIPAEKLFVPNDGAFYGIENTNCTLYVPAGAKETYAATEGWKDFTNIVELPAEPFALTVSAAKYATLYLNYNAIIPEGVEVYTANAVDGNRLMMQQVTGVLPANTGVIVRAEQGTYAFEQSFENAEEIENNLFRGSVEDEYITPENGYKYYVLSMKDGIVGMYADALTGGTFKNNAHKAYLALVEKNLGIYDEEVDTENPGMQLSNSYYFDFSGTTAIEPVINEVEDNIYYDLSGRRVKNPAQGIYIVNGKKVLVK